VIDDTIIVTGSQGFIGSYICNDLLSNGYNVIGIDNFSKYGVVSRSHDKNPNFHFIQEDIINIKDIDYIKNIKIKCIIASAAMIGGIAYFHKYAYDLVATNERILASTFDFSIDAFKKDLLEKIIVLSSSMVFESSNIYPTPESAIYNSPPPQSTYGFQKLSSEYFCKGAFEQYGLPYTIIRPFNCIGIGEDASILKEEMVHGNIRLSMSHVVPDLIYKALVIKDGEKFPILGKGNQIRHYTYGKDIARGIRLAIESQRAINEDFNISSSRSITVLELSEIIWKLIHGNKPMIFEFCESMKYDVQVRSPDTRKAKEILGFECEFKLEEVLIEIIDWVKKNMDIIYD
jgi:UDP-glucose 4-epimerase